MRKGQFIMFMNGYGYYYLLNLVEVLDFYFLNRCVFAKKRRFEFPLKPKY